MLARRLLVAGIVVFALVAGTTFLFQRQAAAALREEVALLRADRDEVARLTTANRQLAAALPPAEELARLRADHVALARLQGEIQKLRDDLDARRRALARAEATSSPSTPAPGR